MIRIRLPQLIQGIRALQGQPLLHFHSRECRKLTYSHSLSAAIIPKSGASDGTFAKSAFDIGELIVKDAGIIRGHMTRGKLEGICTSEINGKTYTGEFKAGVLIHGSGIMKQDTGYYIGEVRNGFKQGFGIWNHNGSTYEGNFKDNLPHGRGKLIRADNTVFEGIFVEGKRVGAGTLTTPQGAVFEGPWANDTEHGLGTVKLGDLTFDVAIYNGAIEAFALRNDATKEYTLLQKVAFPEGILQGALVQGEAEGWCILTTHAGTRLIGEYHNGQLVNGNGRWSQGLELYMGDMREGQMHGYGVWSNDQTGESYVGHFDEGSYHGQGRLVYPDGSVCEGTFHHGQLHGTAMHRDATTEITYQGEWSLDKFHGSGTFSDARRASFSAYFIDGVLMKGRGPLTLPCGREIIPLLREILLATFILPPKFLDTMDPDLPAEPHVFTPADVCTEIVTIKDPKSGMMIKKTTYASGIVHFGPQIGGVPHGIGRTVFPNGLEFEGKYANGVRYGYGSELTARGKYEGIWFNNRKEGEGKFTYADGRVYAGEFLNNQPHGAGSVSYNKSMWRITGNFEHGQVVSGHGQFTYIDRVFFAYIADGALARTGMYVKHHVFAKLKPGEVTAVREGGRIQGNFATPYEKWANQHSPIKHVQGVEIGQDGSIYEGAWLGQMKHGFGKMYYANGHRLKALWDSDELVKKIATF